MKRYIRSNTTYAFEVGDDVRASYFDDDEYDRAQRRIWKLIDRKDVYDYDGFITEYSLYQNTDTDEYVTVFGDHEIYRPEHGDFDMEFDSYEEAREFFDDYSTEEDYDN